MQCHRNTVKSPDGCTNEEAKWCGIWKWVSLRSRIVNHVPLLAYACDTPIGQCGTWCQRCVIASFKTTYLQTPWRRKVLPFGFHFFMRETLNGGRLLTLALTHVFFYGRFYTLLPHHQNRVKQKIRTDTRRCWLIWIFCKGHIGYCLTINRWARAHYNHLN